MSAYQVSDKHIAFIVAFAGHSLPDRYEERYRKKEKTFIKFDSAACKMLLRANLKSVNHRYKQKGGYSAINKTDFAKYKKDYISFYQSFLTDKDDFVGFLVSIQKLIDCLDYQSCEYPEWPNSKAKKYLDRVSARLASYLAGYMPEYDKAPWGVD